MQATGPIGGPATPLRSNARRERSEGVGTPHISRPLRWALPGIALTAALFFGWKSSQAQVQRDLSARGKYLVDTVGACGSCHTPRKGAEEDKAMYLAGHPASAQPPPFGMEMLQQGIFISIGRTFTAFAGPWGISFATNLTSDKATGLGNWTEQKFILAMRTGNHLGDPKQRPILPPMPWKHYQTMTDEDLRAIWAYLRTVPPIKNTVPGAVNQAGKPY